VRISGTYVRIFSSPRFGSTRDKRRLRTGWPSAKLPICRERMRLGVSTSDGPKGGAMAAKFEIYRDRGGRYRFRLDAGNGKIVAEGQGYATRSDCRAGVEAVKRAALLAGEPTVLDETEDAQGHVKRLLRALT
jgi:uncharacterized protein